MTGTDEQLDRKGVMAIGDDAKASGNNSIALGTSAKAGDLEKTRNADSVTLTGSAKRITKLTTKRSVNNAVAIGTESSVQSDEDIAVGYRATTVASKYHQLPGSGQVAIGSNSNTYGSRGDVAIGSGAETNIRVKNVDHTNGPTEKRDAQSVAIGSVAKAYGSQAVAVGADTRAIGNSSVAIGTDDIELDRTKLETLLPGLANNENLNNKAPNDTTLGSAALGDKPYYVKTASIGTASVALGAMSQAAGDASMAMGLNALAEGDASTAIGPLARSKGKNSIAMGVSAQAAGGKGNTAIGHKAKVESTAGDGNIAIGSSASVKDGAGHVVIGKNASANTVNGYGIAIGSSASIGIGAAADAAAIGTGSRVEGSGIAFGRQAQVTASSTESGIAIGTESSVDGAQKGTAIGYKAKVLRSGDDSGLAIGTESSAGGNEGSIALGKKASVDSSTNAGGVAIGLNASAKGISSIVIGKDAKADDGNQAHVIAIGVGATATGTSQYSSVMGSAAKASREYSTVLGSNANSEVDGGVALGANSISNRHAGGSATGDVRTTNPYIPAGAGAAQVNAINATKGTTGAVSVGSDTVKRQIINVAAGTDDSDAVNVAQLKAVTSNASWTVQGNGSDVNAVKNGSKVNFADGTNTTASVTKDASGKVTAVKYNLKKDVNLGTDGSLTINGNTYINKDGINAGNKQITNVASGGDVVTNAANIGDINRIVTAKDKYITKGKATYQTNGDGTATLTGTNGLSANVTGLKNNYVTSGSVSNDGKTLTLERNDTGKVNVDLSKIFTEVAKEDYHLVANPEAGSQGKYKADSSGNMVLTVANEKGEKKQVTLTDIASKAQQNTNTTNITNINKTIEKGLNFGGDSGADINKKLGEKLEIKGGASADLTDGNIGVVSDGAKLNVKLKKDVNLGADGSLTINGKTYVNKDGLNANGQKITNVADGTANSDAVNLGQLNAAIGGTAKATTVKAKDANVTVTEGTNAAGGKEYTVGLGDKVTLGSAADKKIIVDGTSGKITAGSKVTIDGTTGDIQAGTVKVTGAGTVNELTNRTWDIDNPTVVHGQAATEDQLKTVSDGVKTNKTNITNINNTIGKGLNFGGDSGAVINKKLGEKLEIKGGASADLTDDNIGVVSDGTKLNVKLKKDVNLGPDGSLTINGKTYVNKDGLNANGQKITNVSNGTVNSDAVNFGQLKDAVAAGKTILKDGKNTTVEGEGTVANPYKVNVNDDLVLGKKGADGKDGSIGVNGKDGSSVVIHGKDGISIKGKDGKDGVTLKAKDGANGTEGQIGLTGPAGKDGKSTHADIGVNAGPASLDPAKNLSATEMTRLYYVDEKGDHQVATMDDGMKFAGNTGLAIKKLNSTMTIRGTGTKADTEYDPSNIKTMVDADGNMIVGLDKNLKADSVGINGKDGRDGATIKGGDGKPGVDGTNITRLIIEEKNGKQHDIATLDDGMKYGGDTGDVIKKKLNEQVNVVGGIKDESKLTTDDNIGVVSDGSNNLKVRLAKDVKLNSVTAGNVVMDTTGFYVKKMTRTPAGTVSLTADGLNNGGNKIANIAAGEADTDAVNVGQLKNQSSEIVNKGFGIKAEDGIEVKKKLGETVDVVGDGKNISTRVEGGRVRVGLKDDILLNSVTTGRTRMDTNGLTVQDGSGNTAVTVDKDGLKIKDGPSVTKSGIDAGGKKITNVAAGEADTDAVNVSQLKKAAASATTKVADGKNTTVTSETNADGSKTYHVNLNDDITLGTDPSKQISIKGTEGTIKAGQVTVNGTAGTVNGLTNKTWDPNNITSGQAATEDQLKVVSGQAGKHSSVTAGSNISVTTGTNANGGTEYKVAVVDTPTFKTVTTGNTVMSNSGLTIKNGPSITQTGVDAGGKRITNVAAGKADTDAVNVGQLKQIGGAINKVDNRINRVGAGAAALAALHPLDFDPDDKWDFTLGYGNYKDAHSLALGAFYRPNEDTMISVGGSIGGGENMVNAGLSMKLGQGNHVSTSKVAMAKEIKDLRAELENVKGALLKVADGRPLDSMDMDKMQLFPDVPENHWAYDYVATLAGNGVIVGYPDGQFGGDRMMTRYEMAALIYRAMQNGAAADDRMARALKEFEPELERIRVDTISKHKDGTPDIQRVRVIKGRG